jgi:hypothetical protein
MGMVGMAVLDCSISLYIAVCMSDRYTRFPLRRLCICEQHKMGLFLYFWDMNCFLALGTKGHGQFLLSECQ